MEFMSFIELDSEHLTGYAELRVFPFTLYDKSDEAPKTPPIVSLQRPYQEIVDLLRMAEQIFYTILRETADYQQWNHVSNPVVYINTLGTLVAIPRFLWFIYSTVTDTSIHSALPPPYTALTAASSPYFTTNPSIS
jgi:hypothetical protein